MSCSRSLAGLGLMWLMLQGTHFRLLAAHILHKYLQKIGFFGILKTLSLVLYSSESSQTISSKHSGPPHNSSLLLVE